MVAPHLLAVDDVIYVEETNYHQEPESHTYRIVSFEVPGTGHHRKAVVCDLDTNIEKEKLFSARRGIGRMVKIIDGPKLESARSGQAEVKHNGRWHIWMGLKEGSVV